MIEKNVLLQLSGSIACYKACDLLSQLVAQGYSVKVACSAAALKFVGEATLEALSGFPITTDSFQTGQLFSHIHLNRWADITILYPATANRLNRFANGLGGDILGDLFLARDPRKPFYVFPAMNSMMLKAASVEASINKLLEWGVEVFKTREGRLACGDIGDGKVMQPEVALQHILACLAKRKKTSNYIQGEHLAEEMRTAKWDSDSDLAAVEKPKLLITGGGTREFIDGVRFIANFSSGTTAGFLGDTLTDSFSVTYLHSKIARPIPKAKNRMFETYEDLAGLLESELKTEIYTYVIQMAAVSDFKLTQLRQNGRKIEMGRLVKLASSDTLNIELTPQGKLIDKLYAWSRCKNIKIVGFKLTQGVSQQESKLKSEELLKVAGVCWVIQNALENVLSEGRRRHQFVIYEKAKGAIYQPTKEHLGQWFLENLTVPKVQTRNDQGLGEVML